MRTDYEHPSYCSSTCVHSKRPYSKQLLLRGVWERELFRDLKSAAGSILKGEPAYVTLPNNVNPDTRQTEWDIQVVQF